MFVALSCFTIANDMSDEVQAAFRQRPHLVDSAPGYLGMEVMNPIDCQSEIWLMTRWHDEQCYRSWHGSHDYHESHKAIPKGLKLVPGSAKVRLFRCVCGVVGPTNDCHGRWVYGVRAGGAGAVSAAAGRCGELRDRAHLRDPCVGVCAIRTTRAGKVPRGPCISPRIPATGAGIRTAAAHGWII